VNKIYLIFYISSIVISSLVTAIFIERNAIARKWANYKSKREKQREERIKRIVLTYLEELKNGTTND
jgi:hypothetical protein